MRIKSKPVFEQLTSGRRERRIGSMGPRLHFRNEALSVSFHQQIGSELNLFLFAVYLDPPQTPHLSIEHCEAFGLQHFFGSRLSRSRTRRTRNRYPMAATGHSPDTKPQPDHSQKQDENNPVVDGEERHPSL